MSDPVVSGIRQAFYSGLARACLQKAWADLNDLRERTPVQRLFRGEHRLREGIPLLDIATQLGRDVGVIGRWFRGETAGWAELLVAMTALDADWSQLGCLPTKSERKMAACIQALVYIRKKGMASQGADAAAPTVLEIERLSTLFSQDGWAWIRRTARRQVTLERLADQSKLDWQTLDDLDRRWGDVWARLLDAYLASTDIALWEEAPCQ